MANIIKLIHPIGSSEAKARDLALDRIGASIASYGGQNQVFRKINRYFHQLSPSRVRTSREDIVIRRRGREDVFVPMIFGLVIGAVPHWLFNLFGQKPHQRVLGRNQRSQDRAEGITKVLDYDMERAGVFLQSIPIALSNYKYGTGIGKIGYSYKSRIQRERYRMKAVTGFNPLTGKAIWGDKTVTEKQPIIDFDGPSLDPVSPYLWHPDPLYWRIPDMRFTGETRWTDLGALKEVNRQYRELTGDKTRYENLDKIPKLKRSQIGLMLQMDYQDDTAEAMGWNVSPLWKGRWRSLQEAELDSDNVIMIREYWEDDRLIEVANDEIVIHDGENPYDDKEKPYVTTVCFPVEYSPWGKGYGHVAKGGQEEVNSWRNLTLRQARFNVHNVWGVPEGQEIDIDELEPNKIYQVPFYVDKPLLVPLMKGQPLPPEAQYMEAMLQLDVNRALGTPEGEAGSAWAGEETATGARLRGASSAMKLKMQGAIGEQSFLVQMGKKFLSRRRQFGSDEMVFRVAGADGAIEFLQITRQDLEGEYDIEPVSGMWHPNLDVLRQQLTQTIAVIRGDPTFMQMHDMYEVWKLHWKMFPGVPAPERFLIPPAAKTWDPEKENIILDAGQWIQVTANEAHQDHYNVHMQGMVRAAAKPGGDRAIDVYAQHLEEHKRYLQQAIPPPQEMPGLKGAAGNVPNLERATETEAGITSRIEGGVGV